MLLQATWLLDIVRFSRAGLVTDHLSDALIHHINQISSIAMVSDPKVRLKPCEGHTLAQCYLKIALIEAVIFILPLLPRPITILSMTLRVMPLSFTTV